MMISFTLNGTRRHLEVRPEETLLDLLREELDLTGTKHGCDGGECGACTVLVNGRPVSSCLVLAPSIREREVMTIEGLADNGKLHPVQQAFIDHGAPQCGFCSPGMILTAKAFLEANPTPSRAEVRRALAGNLCRCTGYMKMIDAVMDAADRLHGGR